MKNINIIFGLFSLLSVVACSKELSNSESGRQCPNWKLSSCIEATIEPQYVETSKTHLGTIEDKQYALWTAGDAIKVFSSDGSAVKFSTTDGDATGANFFCTGEMPANLSYAVYPYDESSSISDNTLSITLPETQYYKEGSFAEGANIAVGKVVNNKTVAFKNVCGYLKLNLSGSGISVKRIVLKGKDGEKLNGTFTVDASADEPVASPGGRVAGDDQITLDCGEGVSIEDGKEFIFTVPVGVFTKGFTATVECPCTHTSDVVVVDKTLTFDCTRNLQTAQENTIVRSTIKNMKEKAVELIPEGYTELKYIETSYNDYTSVQYFDTGFAPQTNAKVQYVLTPLEMLSDSFFYGCMGSDGTHGRLYYYIGNDKHRVGFGRNGADSGINYANFTHGYNVNARVDAIIIKTGIVINGETKVKSLNSNLKGNVLHFYVGKCNDSREPERLTSKTQIHVCRIWDGTTWVRYYIPVKNSEGVPGMYDLVNDTFNPSQSANAFVAGPKKSLTQSE